MDIDEICEDTQSDMITSADSPDKNTPVLPPCVICEGKASGFHYGANTCEPCKGFFRRCDKRKKIYKCRQGTGNCKILPGHRKSCSFCRRQKCLSLGMSRAGIKIGRYTLKKRNEIILELKKPKQDISRSEQMTILSLLPPSTPQSGQNSPDLTMPFDIDQMIRTITEIHGKIFQSFGSFEDIKKAEKRCVEEKKLYLNTFGPPLVRLSDEQYEEFYWATGIDVDDRQHLMKQFGVAMEKEHSKYVNFVKAIPGFLDLAIEDKVNLVKSSLLDFWFLGNYRGQNDEHELAVRPDGGWYGLNTIGRVCDIKLFQEMFSFAQTMKKLNLCPEEIVILQTICVMFPDRCRLQNRRKVEEIQWKLIQCLMYLLDKNHKETSGMFALVIDRVVAMRDLEDLYCTFVREVLRWPATQNHTLLVELFAV